MSDDGLTYPAEAMRQACAEAARLRAEVERLQAQVDLVPGDYWLTSIGDGKGRAIVTYERRLLVEQYPDREGRVLWSDLTDIYLSGASWYIVPRAALASGDEVRAEVERLWAKVAAAEALMPKWEAEIYELTRAKEFGIAEAFRSAQGDLRAALDSSAEVRDA